MEQPRLTPTWLKSRFALTGGVIILLALLATGWWWNNRPADTIFMDGAVVILDPNHFTVVEDGSCLGTRTGYMGGATVVIELGSGDEQTFEMEPGRVDSNTCRLEFSGDITVSDTYTAHIGRYTTPTLDHGAISMRVGTGETDETFLRADFIADPWAGET